MMNLLSVNHTKCLFRKKTWNQNYSKGSKQRDLLVSPHWYGSC